MARFRYDPALLERFPAIVGGVIHATGEEALDGQADDGEGIDLEVADAAASAGEAAAATADEA